MVLLEGRPRPWRTGLEQLYDNTSTHLDTSVSYTTMARKILQSLIQEAIKASFVGRSQ